MFSSVIILNMAVLAIDCAVAPTHLFVTRVGPCIDVNMSVVTISELRISRKLYDFSLKGDLNITRDIENGWIMKATMEKCQDIRNLDTCDYFRSFPVIKDGCSSDESDDSQDKDIYNMFFHYSQPRLTCPLRAGVYKIMSYPFFMEDNYLSVSESKISTSVFGYTFRLEGYTNQEKIACVDIYLQLVYIREHNWVEIEYPEDVTTEQAPSEEYNDQY